MEDEEAADRAPTPLLSGSRQPLLEVSFRALSIPLQRYSANDRMSLRVGLRPAHVLHQRGQREPVPHHRPALPGHAAEGAARGGLPPAGQRGSHGRTDIPPFPNQTLLITKPL